MTIQTTNRPKESKNLRGFFNLLKMWRTLKKSVATALRYEKWRLITIVTIAVITGIIPYFQNGLFGQLIDAIIDYKNSNAGLRSVLILIIALIIATIIPSVIGLIETFVETTFRFNLHRKLELQSLEKISTLDIATVESTEYQELTQKANERGGSISIYNFLSHSADNLGNLVGVVASLVILSFIDRTLLIYALLGSIPALYVQLKYGKDIYFIWDLNSNNRRKYFNRRNHFQQAMHLTQLKLYQLAKKLIDDIKQILNDFDNELKSAEKNKLGYELFALIVFATFLGLGLWRIIHLTLMGAMPIGKMLFAYTTYRGFKGTLMAFFRKIGWMTENANYSDYWLSLQETKSQIDNNPSLKQVDYSIKPPKIEFKNVSFRYSEQNQNYALQNLSVIINPGNKIAIVGLSGAGKTTLIKLLCRVYDPETGQILIDNQELKTINLESWQKQMAVLFQDFVTYEVTAKESIAWGDTQHELDEAKVIKAAKMAKAHDFIERLPKKYDQLLWRGFEDGVDLSKGEKQRIALARVLYRESPITILDEPTSSVDALAEQEIFETLEKLPNNKTVILISHRFSTVKNADNILVIEHGKLIEQGKHTELMAKNGKYAELYKIQAESYQ